ncbi:hypothetical protein VNO78_15155 [Psophocarpus tetragonolobus]|uniref:BHLH domain-containing protein n=1 Tax=Psophocarpus tetragonolobus TaxID=3891 RepID=A0AAN9SJ68_PSOTE
MEEYDLVVGERHEDEFLREILGGGTSSSSSSSNSDVKSFKRSSIVFSPAPPTPSAFLLSFDTSTAEPITHSDLVKEGFEVEVEVEVDPFLAQPQPRKKVRKPCETQHHIIAERKRRQELTGSIIALSATIPGLKKMDKAYVLSEAVNYTKQLQERVKELENQSKYKRVVDSATLIRKAKVSSNKSSINCEMNESLFEVEARVLDEEVLIGIHCEKQKDIVLKIHEMLEKLHLSTTSSSVLPFGTSTLIINIIAQMNDKYIMSIYDLVEKLKEYLLEEYDMQH